MIAPAPKTSDWPGWIQALIEAMPTDRETDSPVANIPPRLFKLWVILARYSDNDTGEAWPSLTTLARRSGCDVSNVSKALTEGEVLGLWTRHRSKGGSSHATTRYLIHRFPTTGEIATGGDSTSGKNAISPLAKSPHRTLPYNQASRRDAVLPGITPPAADNNPADKATAYTFASTEGPWSLTVAQRDKLRDEFPYINADTELAGLADWTQGNPDKRKKPGAMFTWLRRLLAKKQTERPLATAAFYPDGFQHTSLPTDPTPEALRAFLAEQEQEAACAL